MEPNKCVTTAENMDKKAAEAIQKMVTLAKASIATIHPTRKINARNIFFRLVLKLDDITLSILCLKAKKGFLISELSFSKGRFSRRHKQISLIGKGVVEVLLIE